MVFDNCVLLFLAYSCTRLTFCCGDESGEAFNIFQIASKIIAHIMSVESCLPR